MFAFKKNTPLRFVFLHLFMKTTYTIEAKTRQTILLVETMVTCYTILQTHKNYFFFNTVT